MQVITRTKTVSWSVVTGLALLLLFAATPVMASETKLAVKAGIPAISLMPKHELPVSDSQIIVCSRVFSETDVDLLARTVWGEARGTSTSEQKLVIWTILQRVMSDCGRWPDTIEGVITQNRQFHGYNSGFPVDPYIRETVLDVLEAWASGAEPKTMYPFAVTLPYFFFRGDGQNNWFRESWV